MNTKKLVSTAKDLASVHPAFLLSELSTRLPEDIPLPELYRALSPHLLALDLTAEKTGGDYRIRRRTMSAPYTLSEQEKERIGSFFSKNRVPAALEKAIQRAEQRSTQVETGRPTGSSSKADAAIQKLRQDRRLSREELDRPVTI